MKKVCQLFSNKYWLCLKNKGDKRSNNRKSTGFTNQVLIEHGSFPGEVTEKGNRLINKYFLSNSYFKAGELDE